VEYKTGVLYEQKRKRFFFPKISVCDLLLDMLRKRMIYVNPEYRSYFSEDQVQVEMCNSELITYNIYTYIYIHVLIFANLLFYNMTGVRGT
jgi:hypothetical protein